MRLGIVTIPRLPTDGVPVPQRLAEIGRRAEALGYSGVWTTDAIGRGRPTMDPLAILSLLAAVTETVELGTCVLQLPLRHPVELAHRVQSLNLLTGGRLRLGVGAGSTEADFLAVEADYGGRFAALAQALDVMRRAWNGEAVSGKGLPLWPGTEGGPPLLLGAWRSPRWIDVAARQCQGWIASGIYSTWEDLETGIAMYRAAAGEGGRMVLANLFTDLRPEPENLPMIGRSKINLCCPPAEAARRLKRIEGLGVDDALLVIPFDQPQQLEQARELYPA